MPSSKIKILIFIKKTRYINIFKNLHEYIIFVYKKDYLKIDTDPHFFHVDFFYEQHELSLYIDKKALYIDKIFILLYDCIYRVK